MSSRLRILFFSSVLSLVESPGEENAPPYPSVLFHVVDSVAAVDAPCGLAPGRMPITIDSHSLSSLNRASLCSMIFDMFYLVLLSTI